MKSNDFNKISNELKDTNKIEDNISLLDKINNQKNIFQKEFENYKIKQ